MPTPPKQRRIGSRTSLFQLAGNRNTAHPINAMLNYAYAILESQVRIQCVAEGYDPTLGIMHESREGSSAFVFDMMELERPKVDRSILEFVKSHKFHGADFVIRSDGVCRLNPAMAHLCLALLTGEWLDRYISFWGWTFYPMTLCWPTSLIPMALYLDIVLLLSKSWIVTAIVGSMGFSLLMYSWVIRAPYHQATEQYGTLMSLADVTGFHYVRTSMPEYIRIIERGTMRTFGKDVVGVSSFFSGFVSIIVYFVWWFVGKMFSTTKYMATI